MATAYQENPANDPGVDGAYRARRVETGVGDPTVGSLIASLLSDTNRLVRDEVRLAKAEVGEKVNQARSGAVSIALGVGTLLLGAIFLIQSLVYLLDLVLPLWAAALIVGGVIALIGFVMLKKGTSELKARNLAPTRTQANIKRDAQTFKEAA